MFRVKPLSQILADAEHPDHRLKRTLTVTDLIALGVGRNHRYRISSC